MRSEVLMMLIATLLAVSCIAAMLPIPSWNPIPLVAGLWITAGAIYWALRFGPAIATAALVIGLTATLTALLHVYPGGLIAEDYCLIVLAACGAYNWRIGLASAVLISGIVLREMQVAPALLSPEAAAHSLLLIWGVLLLAWLSARPLRTALGWAWASYALAQSRLGQVELRQAELARLTKSLNETCDKLERLNWQLKAAREEAEAARRIKAEFAATVGHELRTPVNLIIGFSQMMISPRRDSYYYEALPESYRADVQAIYRNACHISGLVDDILDLSQIDSHRMGLERELISLAEVAGEAAASIDALYTDARLTLTIDVSPDLPSVPADRGRVRQVLVNLLFNAVRFTQRGGVTVTAGIKEHEMVVAVSDSGVGIPSNELPRLFDAFHEAHTPTRGRRGSGLGLAVCKRFVELHGGNIWAESALGEGTTISFTLPLHDNVSTSPMPPRLPSISSHELPSVAVLDPIGDATRVLQRFLDGYQVRRLAQVGQAERLVEEGQLEALIVTSAADQQAWHCYQQAKQTVREIPTLYCPLRTRHTIAETLGVANYLVKPVSRDQLARALRKLRQPLHSIVLIEDDAEMRTLLARTIRSLSRRYRVTEASDGAEGLQRIREERPDVILLDLLMPNTDGYAVLRAIRQDRLLRRTPIVVISGMGADEEIMTPRIEVSRFDGFSLGSVVAFLKSNLDLLVRARADADHEKLPLW
ncbi:MAG TPA: ATP-binding protein [Chloroflexota bacterium]|nr:ATP-binding protein [Chloroflexota bacterium]